MKKLKILAAAAILAAGTFTAAGAAGAASITLATPAPASLAPLSALQLIPASTQSPAADASVDRGQATIAHHRRRWRFGRSFYWWCYRHDFHPRTCWIFR